MRICHVTNSLTRTGGGTASAIWGLAAAQQKRGDEVSVLGLSDPYDACDRPTCSGEEMQIRTFERSGPYRLGWSAELHSFMQEHCGRGKVDVLHQHGIWSLLSHSVGTVQKRWETPTIVATHGMLGPVALRHGRLRKKLFGLMIERPNFVNCRCLHALSVNEARSMRAWGLANPIAVVPNGIDAGRYCKLPDPAAFADRLAKARGRRIVLYLSRLHPLKGVGLLIESWGRLGAIRGDDWLLVIAGGGIKRFERRLREFVEEIRLGESVMLTGPLYGKRKLEALSAADAFVLPSHSEGFPVAVLEAMACGLPVVVTERCNIADVGEHGAGWVVRANVESLEQVMGRCLSLSEEERKRIGKKGLELVRRKYTWDLLAERMNEVYEWMLGKRGRAACVMTDK